MTNYCEGGCGTTEIWDSSDKNMCKDCDLEAEENYYCEIVFESALADDDGNTEKEIVDKQFKDEFEAMGYIRENHQKELDFEDYRIVINSVDTLKCGTQVKEELIEVKDYGESYYQYVPVQTSFECKRIYNVARGNIITPGNSYATIEVSYNSIEDMENDDDYEVEYCEYGENPFRDYVGNCIEISPDGYKFRVTDE